MVIHMHQNHARIMHFDTAAMSVSPHQQFCHRCPQFGLRGCKARNKPLMTDVQRCNRIDWTKKNSRWICETWEKVLFGDESTFCLFGSQADTYVRRFPGEEFKPECLNLTVKHPLKVMVWGCMAASGVGRLHIADGMVSRTKYITVLQKCMVPSVQQLFTSWFLFQDDNAPCHCSKQVINWKRQNNIDQLTGLPNLPI
uniref:Tc1-like transposase DDE domain-containing protein n=1 Tax=Paramormyrops kingsleyae TaxID=1676925 RepID=A0A3B3R7X0_9TELE